MASFGVVSLFACGLLCIKLRSMRS
ncbi:hypothetical protein F383_33583 [Gossypium arboreum]|uniref:Uncharacterized protein n=1 Tax=Gossypium arboreum TaxID=29729 RepID=A0A0B0PT01_GOSAR|nr:hypothetical protein F383_33583 [Gossypium arboreum]